MNKAQMKLFQQLFAANMPIFEDLIDNICKDYGMEDKIYEIKQRYLYEDKSKIVKILNKKKSSGRKRRRTSYTAFLSDTMVLKKLKEENPELTNKEINGLRGKLWKKMTVEQKQPYKATADKQNVKSGLVKQSIEERKEEPKIEAPVAVVEKKPKFESSIDKMAILESSVDMDMLSDSE